METTEISKWEIVGSVRWVEETGSRPLSMSTPQIMLKLPVQMSRTQSGGDNDQVLVSVAMHACARVVEMTMMLY